MTALDLTWRDGATGDALQATDWRADQLAALDRATMPQIPVIGAADVRRVSAGLDVWDAWPLQLLDGRTAKFDGRALWMTLSAPVMAVKESAVSFDSNAARSSGTMIVIASDPPTYGISTARHPLPRGSAAHPLEESRSQPARPEPPRRRLAADRAE